MINAGSFRKGSKILYKGDPYDIIDFQHSLRARGRGKIWTKMKNLKTGNVLEDTFGSDETFKEPDLDTRDMQYLYDNEDNYAFMDSDTFEQYFYPKSTIGESKWFLKEGEIYRIQLFEGSPLSIELPASFILKVVETEPGIKGDTVSSSTKKAVLESGLVIKVPLFIKIDDNLKVDTRTLEYISRA